MLDALNCDKFFSLLLFLLIRDQTCSSFAMFHESYEEFAAEHDLDVECDWEKFVKIVIFEELMRKIN